MKSKKILLSIGVLIVLLAAAGLGYRAWASNQSASEAEIQTATLQTGSLASTLSSSGNVRSGQNATLTWQTSGKVLEVLLQPGDVVEEGQVLTELDPQSLSNDLIQARQNLIDALQAKEDLYDLTLQQAQALQAIEEARTTWTI